MRRGLLAWVVPSVVGVAVVLVPDAGPRVFSLSAGHVPSAGDLVGVAMLLAGWVCLLVPLIRARSLVPAAPIVALVVVAGLAVVAWSVGQDAGSRWVLGAGVAVAAQLVAAVVVARGPR